MLRTQKLFYMKSLFKVKDGNVFVVCLCFSAKFVTDKKLLAAPP